MIVQPTNRSLLLALLLMVGCSAGKPHYPAELLARTARQLPQLGAELSAIELVLPFAQLFDNPQQRGSLIGTLRVAAQKYASPVALEPIGNFSRLICSYPKLAVSLPGRSGPRTRLFLSPHCADGEHNRGTLPDERHVSRHYAAYRLQAALGLPSLRASLVQVNYRDSDSKRSIESKPALLVEDLADLAIRLGSTRPVRLLSNEKGRYRDLSAQATARFHLFQVLINNPDWALFDLKPVSLYSREQSPPHLHNAAVIALSNEQIPIAFDFDLSSLAGVPETIRILTSARYRHFLWAIANPNFLAGESELLRWMVIRLQHFRTLHRPRVARAAIGHFLARKPTLLSSLTGLPDDAADRARQHITTFFAALGHYALARVAKAAPLYRDRDRARMLCQTLTPDAPLQLIESTPSAGLLRVRLVQYLVLRQGTPHTTPACLGDGKAATPDVGWIDAAAVDSTRR